MLIWHCYIRWYWSVTSVIRDKDYALILYFINSLAHNESKVYSINYHTNNIFDILWSNGQAFSNRTTALYIWMPVYQLCLYISFSQN